MFTMPDCSKRKVFQTTGLWIFFITYAIGSGHWDPPVWRGQ